jgi:uncharacterized protein (DUF736 family)
MNVGGLWKNKSQKKVEYFSGNIDTTELPKGKVKILVFKKMVKKNDKQPDYDIVWNSPDEQKKFGNSVDKSAPVTENPFSDSSIPF